MKDNDDNCTCPECGHTFLGNGWDGIDAHWRAKHEDKEEYSPQLFARIKSGSYVKELR